MATYLPGITDYIPHIQPFKPDYNFYQKALETKEAQYKAGYDKISKLYGTLLNSELSREPDKVKRDQFFTKVQKDIQRMSSVDLSLQENVNTAYKVFQPLIDDQNFTHDVVYTKNFRNQQQRANQLKNCFDPKKCGDLKWWKEGDLEMQYKRDEYANADDQTALTMRSPTYTPYVDIAKKLEISAKEAGIDVQTVVDGKDGYTYTMTNGQQVVGSLANYFTAILSSDPNVQAVYNTQGYLERKNFTYANAEKFGGKEQAETAYLKDKMRLINESTKDPKKQATLAIDLLNSDIALMQERMGKGIPESQVKKSTDILNNLFTQLGIEQAAKDHIDGTLAAIDPKETDGLSNAEMIHRVDAAMAGANLTVDSGKYANYWARLHSKVSREVDVYQKMAVEFEYSKRLKDYGRKADKVDAFALEDRKSLNRMKEETFKYNLEHGITEDEGERWKKDRNGVISTAKVPLHTTNQEVIDKYEALTKDAANRVNFSTHAQLYATYKNGATETEREAARRELNKVFGGTATERGYLNNDYTLISLTDKLPDAGSKEKLTMAQKNDREGHHSSWQNLYKRVVTSINNPVNIMSNTSLALLNKQKSDYEEVQGTKDLFWKEYVDDRATIYRQIKGFDESRKVPGTKLKYYHAADIANVSFNEEQFIQKFTAAYGHHYPDVDLTENGKDAYEELVKEFNVRYDENQENLGIRSLSPSWSVEGGGAIGSHKMVASFDGARLSKGSKADIESIRTDLDNNTTIAVRGAFTPSDKDSPTQDLTHDPGAAAAARYFLDTYISGGWKKGKETSERRPLFTVTYNGVVGAGGDENPDSGREAITLHFEENSADQNRGTETKPNSVDFLYEEGVFNPDVTLYVDKATAKNLMHANTMYTDEDYRVQNGGVIVLNGYETFGGVAEIKMKDGKLVTDGKLKFVNPQGELATTPLPEQIATTGNVAEFKKSVYAILGKLSDDNIINQINAYDSQKKVIPPILAESMNKNYNQ